MDKYFINKLVLVCVVFVLHISHVGTYPFKPRIASYRIDENRALKKSLGIDEDSYFNFTELTTKYGYPTETHQVITEDGYILTVFRILPKCNGTTKKHPIILYHGLMDSSDVFILPNTKIGLGYALSRDCNDVWVMNQRGNVYSRKHTTLNPDEDVEYWKFSFDEHGRFDIPAVIDHVLNVTQKAKLIFLGHSQGTTSFFVMASLRPEYNDKVQLSFQMAPVAWMKHVKSPLPRLLAPHTKEVKEILETLGYSEIFAKHQILHNMLELICYYSPHHLCAIGLILGMGYFPETLEPRSLKIGITHLAYGASSTEIAHYGQLISSGRFQRYDLGKEENLKAYGQPSPPEYDLSKISSPVVLMTGHSDWLSDLKDLDILKSKLPNLVEDYVIPDPKWSHINYLWGEEAPKYIHNKIFMDIDKYKD